MTSAERAVRCWLYAGRTDRNPVPPGKRASGQRGHQTLRRLLQTSRQRRTN